MTIDTLHIYSIFLMFLMLPISHNFIGAMAIDASHSFLIMDVCLSKFQDPFVRQNLEMNGISDFRNLECCLIPPFIIKRNSARPAVTTLASFVRNLNVDGWMY